MEKPTNAPRGRSVRAVRAGALGLAVLISSVGPQVWARETTDNRYLGWLAGGVLPSLLGAWLAPKVSYRRRDAVVFLTMGWSAVPSALIFTRILWRVAHLPHRDWPLRADEVAAGRYTSCSVPAANDELCTADPARSLPEPRVVPSRPPWSRDVTNG